MAKFHGNILSLSENIAKSFRWGELLIDSYFIEYMAFQYHVGPFHLREAIPRFGDLGWLAPDAVNIFFLLTYFTRLPGRGLYKC